MTTGTWHTLEDELPDRTSHVSSTDWQRHKFKRGTWTQGVTKRGKPPPDHRAIVLRVIKFAAIIITLLVSIGWAFVGAAVLIW